MMDTRKYFRLQRQDTDEESEEAFSRKKQKTLQDINKNVGNGITASADAGTLPSTSGREKENNYDVGLYINSPQQISDDRLFQAFRKL